MRIYLTFNVLPIVCENDPNTFIPSWGELIAEHSLSINVGDMIWDEYEYKYEYECKDVE